MHAPLSNLCRPLASKRDQTAGSVLMAYNAAQKRGVMPGLMTSLMGHPLFEVMPNARQPYRSPRIALEEEGREGAPGLNASLMVTGLLSPAPLGEATLVAAAASGLESEVARILIKTVEDEALQRRTMGRPTLSVLAEWRKDLEPRLVRALELIGLRVSDLKIEVWSDAKAETRQLVIDMQTRPMDHPVVVRLSGSVVVDPMDNGREQRALYPFTEADLGRILAGQIERNFGVNTLHTSPRRVHVELTDRIRPWLADRGYVLARAEISIKFEEPLPPTDYNDEVPVDVQVINYDQNLKVIHRLQLELESLSKALKAGDPISQIKAECERVTRKMLYNRSYAQVVLAFDQLERGGKAQEVEEIRNAVMTTASECGYRVVLLVSLPDAPPNKLQRDGVHLRLPADENDPRGEAFELQDVGVKGGVKVSVDAKLPELSRLFEWIGPDINLQTEMERILRQTLSSTMRRFTAHRFHTEFSSPAPGSNRPSVAEELAGIVREELIAKFHLTSPTVDIRMAETALVTRFKALRRGSHKHEFDFRAADRSLAGETVVMQVVYTVEGIAEAGWYTFQGRDYQSGEEEQAAIRQIIELDIRRMLEDMTPEFLAGIRQAEFQKRIAMPIAEKIARSLGLSVDINTILPSRKDENQMRAVIGTHVRSSAVKQAEIAREAAEKKIGALLDQQNALYERRQLLLSEGAGAQDIEEVDGQIKKVEELLLPANTVPELVGDIRKLGGRGAASLDEHLGAVLGLAGPSTAKPDDEQQAAGG